MRFTLGQNRYYIENYSYDWKLFYSNFNKPRSIWKHQTWNILGYCKPLEKTEWKFYINNKHIIADKKGIYKLYIPATKENLKRLKSLINVTP